MTKNAFTLVELMIVISIIAILSVIGMAVFQTIQAKARDSVRKRDLNNLATALEIYYQQNDGKYITVTGGITSCPRSTETTSTFYTNIGPNMSDGVVPKDPKDNTLYCYLSIDGATFTLCANLENDSDPERNTSLCTGYDYVVVPK